MDSWYMISRPALNLEGVHSVSDAAVKERRVPSLCGYPPELNRETFGQNLPTVIVACLGSMVFGGVHCLAWNFTFPTYTEHILWRIASVAITVVPGASLTIITCAYLVADDDKTVPHARITMGLCVVMGFLYTTCRAVVVAIIFLSLRSLPPGVYDEVCWVSHIPHWQT